MKRIAERYYHIVGTANEDDVKIGDSGTNYIKAEVYYSEGGVSMFTYKQTPRGYFMSVHKVGRGKDTYGYWESTAIFDNGGARSLIAEVSRQSKKREAEALEYFEKNIDAYIKQIYPELETEI